MGDVFVECVMGNVIVFIQLLQDFVNEYVWGLVWVCEVLLCKICSLIILVVLIVLKCLQEFKGYVCGVLNNGCMVEEICEVLLYCVVYVGVLVVIDVFCVVQEVIDIWQGEQFV